jgi:hypothetical protein
MTETTELQGANTLSVSLLGNLSIVDRITLKLILNALNGNVWTGYM